MKKTRKLNLSVDDLEVTTFVISSDDANGGTVRGQEDDSNGLTCYTHCWSFCPGETDCCPETHTDCDPTSCYGYTCNGNVTCFDC